MKDVLTDRTADMTAWPRPAWADRLAHGLIDQSLRGLRHGRLTVTSPLGTKTYGRSDELTATVVADASVFRRLLTGGTLAAARSYVRGEWEADDLTAACRIFARNWNVTDRLERGWARLTWPFFAAAHWARRNTRRGSRRNIGAHYDLGNDFFRLFLDETMTYSCAVFEPESTPLAEASLAKIDRLCQKLDLQPGAHLLEIGTGWGALAIRAASKYGCTVTTTTISQQQYDLASQRVAEAGVSDRVTVLLADYRDLTGNYDGLVSVEMIEAVGADFLDTFFAQCARLVRPGGRIALQAITVPDARYESYLRSVDFIRQDVFPGSCLVSRAAMERSARRTGVLQSWAFEDLTPHYARTLRLWRERFRDRLDDVRALGYSEEFIRRWDLYLASCEAGFAERTTGLVQVVWNKTAPSAAGASS